MGYERNRQGIATEIEVFADPVCPWCYIGLRRLYRALDLLGGADGLRLVWRAFQLNPAMPKDGMDRYAYLSAKFGGAERARVIYECIRREGEHEGIGFAFGRIARTPNTVDAHRLVRFAGARADCMMAALFAAYFENGLDIGDRSVLAALAADAGIADKDAVRDFLASEAEREAVQAEDSAARARGITGVPYFVIDGRIALHGAQPGEMLARAVELARADAELRFETDVPPRG